MRPLLPFRAAERAGFRAAARSAEPPANAATIARLTEWSMQKIARPQLFSPGYRGRASRLCCAVVVQVVAAGGALAPGHRGNFHDVLL
jgi:hypothetical protein